MGPLRVAFQRREPLDSRMEFVEVLRYRQIMNVVKNLNTLNFDLAETLIHRIHGRVIRGCRRVASSKVRGGQPVAKRVHPGTRFAFLTAGAAAFGAIPFICRDLPLRCHQLAPYDDSGRSEVWASTALVVATRSASALALEVFSTPFRYWSRRFCADAIRRSMGTKVGNASWNASTSTALGG